MPTQTQHFGFVSVAHSDILRPGGKTYFYNSQTTERLRAIPLQRHALKHTNHTLKPTLSHVLYVI